MRLQLDNLLLDSKLTFRRVIAGSIVFKMSTFKPLHLAAPGPKQGSVKALGGFHFIMFFFLRYIEQKGCVENR